MGRWLTVLAVAALATVAGVLAWPRLGPAWHQFGADATTAAVLRGQHLPDAADLRAAHDALAAANAAMPLPETAAELADLVLALQGKDTAVAHRQRLTAAIAALERAVAASPLAADAWFKLALLRAMDLRLRPAAEAFAVNLTLDPNSHGELERKVWLAARVWPAVRLSEVDLLHRPVRTLYVQLGRREAVVNLTFGTPAEELVRAALRGQVMSGGLDAEADYVRILNARRS